MSGYGGKNPWADSGRMNMGNFGGMTQQQGMQMMGNQNTGIGAMAQGAGLMNMGGGISYPIRQQQQAGYGQQQQQQQQMSGANGNSQQNRVFTGTVTKLHENFGFIDDDVFFSTNVVKGPCPKVGDRVLAEAVYNASMPFKWNATRVTPMPTPGMMTNLNNPQQQQQQHQQHHQGGRHGMNQHQGQRGFGRGGGNDVRNEMMGGRDHRSRDSRNRQNDRSGGDFHARDRSRRDDHGQSRERSTRKRSRSKSKSRSPPRRRPRHAPRYNVSVPKVSLKFDGSNVMELRKRYNNLYIPSDFFIGGHVWNLAYPIESPFKIRMPSSFHVMNKELVVPITANKFKYDPPDADYSYVAKVMLIASPGLEELFDKTCHYAEKDSEEVDARDGLVHPSRAIKFLIGMKGKSESMAVGGPWSPSLDGKDPVGDPTVLIKTAIRTCGAMTGIDLTECTQWTRFIEFYYRRQPTATKPARTEVVVLFLPDVWSSMPSKQDHEEACTKYAANLQMRLDGKQVLAPEPPQESMEEGEEEEVDADAEGSGEPKGDPTHWKELDPKTMKVNDLKAELEARGQNSKGLKSQLQARLQKIIQQEEEEEDAKKKEEDGNAEEGTEEKEQEEDEKKDEEEDNSEELDDRMKEKLKSAHKTPSSPCLFVHPNSQIKGGKFDCKVESLSVLLDYRSDDNKEGTFEVSLFAELFNEMLMRDHAFNIYKAIVNAPEPAKKDKDKEKEKDKEKKDEETSKEKEKEKEEEEKKKKMVTKDKDLLLSCSYFDLSHCGYFEAKDLEDIFLSLELALSRAEVKKLSMKLATGHRDTVNYRSITDVEEIAQHLYVYQESDALGKQLAAGFKQFLPGSDSGGQQEDSSQETPQTNKLVKFRGSVIDLEKLTEKLDKAERMRNGMDSQLSKAQKELELVKEQKTKLNEQKYKLALQLEDTKQKVVDQERELMTARGDVRRSMAAMKDVYLRIKPFVETKENLSDKSTQKDAPKEEKVKTNGEEVKLEKEEKETKDTEEETKETKEEIENEKEEEEEDKTEDMEQDQDKEAEENE